MKYKITAANIILNSCQNNNFKSMLYNLFIAPHFYCI